MPKYNPNSIWESKKRPINYKPPVQPTAPARPAARPSEPVIASAPPDVPAQIVHDSDEMEPHKSHAVLWFVAVFAVLLAVGIALFYFFMRPAVGPNVSIGFTTPGQILVGSPFELSIALTNNSQNTLKNAALSLNLPDNVSFVGQSSGQRRMQQQVGDVAPGNIKSETFNVIVTGDPSSIKQVAADLVYSTDASPKAQFKTDGGANFAVGNPAITLMVTPPQNAVSGQNFDMTVAYTNNTPQSFQNVKLVMQYPPAFSFVRSNVLPVDASDDSWNLGTIPASASGTITITGNVVGPANAIYAMNGGLTGAFSGGTYGLSQGTGSLTLNAAPLMLSIALNDTDNYVAGLSDSLDYVLTYTNNSNVTFQNISLNAGLIGSMFDFGTVQTQGSFNSITNTVSWNAANAPQLLNLAAGQSGSVSFRIKTQGSYPIKYLSNKNFTLKVNAQIASATVPPGTQASSTVSAMSTENKVGGAIALAAPTYWKDATAGISNSGPYPPKVNMATQYTVHWQITNYATDADNVTVTASLQSGTTCTGATTTIKGAVSSTLTCNAANGLITWTIPVIPATTGITVPVAEAIFQVQNTPSVNQISNSVTLVGPATLQATDDFTGVTLTASAPAVTTDLPADKTIAPSIDRRVTQ